MSKRIAIKTTVKEIVNYWASHEDECGLSVDFSEAHERCWRCGCERHLERCHIVPDSLGGKDEPSNLVMLCKRCHMDNPNVADPEIMWDWLRAYAVPFYDTFWQIQGMKEYEKIYSRHFRDELELREITKGQDEELREILIEQMDKASYHFGDPHLNVATLAGIYRMTLKEYDRRHGIETERDVTAYVKAKDFL